MRPNLSQISPEATQEPEEQGPEYVLAAQCHGQGRAAQTARGPGSFRPGGAQTGADGPTQIRILCYITYGYAHTRVRTDRWEKVQLNLPAETELGRGVTYRGCAGRGSGAFLPRRPEKSHFLGVFAQIVKNPLPRELNPRPPPYLHGGLSVRPDPQVCTLPELIYKGGPESFQIWAMGFVLSSLNTLYWDMDCCWRLCGGARLWGGAARGWIFRKIPQISGKMCEGLGLKPGPRRKWGRTYR